MPRPPKKNALAAAPPRTARRPLALLLEKNPPPPPPVRFAGKLVVWRVPGFNRRLVTAHVPGCDPRDPLQVVSVRVRENGNFLPGMELPGPGRGLHEIEAGRYELVGECPRGRGRW